jgi:hypothetical protein
MAAGLSGSEERDTPSSRKEAGSPRRMRSEPVVFPFVRRSGSAPGGLSRGVTRLETEQSPPVCRKAASKTFDNAEPRTAPECAKRSGARARARAARTKRVLPPGLLVDYGARRGIQDEPARVIVMAPVEVEHVVQRAGDDIGGAAADAPEVPVIFDEAEDG